MITGNDRNNDSAAPNQAVAAAHSLDDSESTSRALNDDIFFDEELDEIFDDEDDSYPAAIDAGAVNLNLDPFEPEEGGPPGAPSLQHRPKRQKRQPDLHASADTVPSTITTRQSTNTDDIPKPKLKRRNSKIEGENRVLPPPGWHSEAADRHHRQGMILDM